MTSTLDVKTKSGVKFGKELREKDFLFGEGYLNLNHGSFGTFPRAVRDVMRSYQDQTEAQPDHFIRYKYPGLLDESRKAVSKVLNAPADTIVFVPNATTGINTVLRGLTYEPGDYILYFAPIYGACEKTVVYLTETTPAKCLKIEFNYPVEDDWLVDTFRTRVQEVRQSGGRVKVAIFDTIVSNPGVRMPFERLTAACKDEGVLSCIDGAHSIGQIKIDLDRLDPDFYVSNCHKWLHVPRGCAVFYVPVRNQNLIPSTLPTSHGFMPKSEKIDSPLPASSKSVFVNNFEFVGTIDNSPYLCVPAALKYREELGGEEVIRDYCITLVQTAAKHLAGAFGTEILNNKSETMTQCAMANIRLPISVGKTQETAIKAGLSKDDVGLTVRDWFVKTLIDEYGTFIQTFFYDGEFWVRLSGQVYLDMEDFEWATKTLKEMCERVDRGDWAVAPA